MSPPAVVRPPAGRRFERAPTATGLPVRLRDLVGLASLVLAVTVATCGPALGSWYGSWGETGAALDASTTISYPVVAAAAAWVASGPRRRRFQSLLDSSSRSRTSVYLTATAVLGGWAALGALVPALAMWVVTASAATYGHPPVLELVVVLCGVLAAAGLGVLLGTTVPSLLAPAVAAVLVYGAEYLADPGNPALSPLAGLVVADSRERTYRETLLWVLGARAIWLLALAWLFAALATRLPSRWLAPFALTCVVATPLLWVGDSGMRVDHAAYREVCRTSAGLEVCMTAARAHAAPQVARIVREDLDLLPGLDPGRIRLVEEELSDARAGARVDGRTLTVPFGVVNGIDGDAHRASPRDLQVQFTSTLLRSNCPPATDAGSGPPRGTVADVIQAWLFGHTGIPRDGSAGLDAPALLPGEVDYGPVAEFRRAWDAATPSARRRWVAAHRTELVACDLPPSALRATSLEP